MFVHAIEILSNICFFFEHMRVHMRRAVTNHTHASDLGNAFEVSYSGRNVRRWGGRVCGGE